MKTCPYCKGDVPGDALKCKHCGEWLSGPPPAPRNPSLERVTKWVLTFGAIWILIVVTAVLVFYFGVFRPQWRQMDRDFHQRMDSTAR
ncbi:MAG TPA: hypothetical protein VG269_14880 [Tepidisphaeraceae bacterium]|jgi:hypothetical protein|nr:hypothetical protein [Tepidisphaeraceae bacterium]